MIAFRKRNSCAGRYLEGGVPNESDEDGHGTHVCGSIAGSTSSAEGSSNYDGVAKDARLAFTDLAGSDGGVSSRTPPPISQTPRFIKPPLTSNLTHLIAQF